MKPWKALSVIIALVMMMSAPEVAFAATPIDESNFDYQRYANDYADLKANFGYDKNQLWIHYVNYGMREGRIAYSISGDAGNLASLASSTGVNAFNFDANRYANDYADLKAAFGYNRNLLWNHYQSFGIQEGRKAYAVSGMEAVSVAGSAYVNGVVAINQNPELPTGCEVTALTMALNWAGYGIDKLTLARNYLPKAWPGAGVNPYQYFIGNPESRSSYGCYAGAILGCAANYGATAMDVSGCGFDQLMVYISSGQPVMVWGTMNMIPTGRGGYVYTRLDGVNENWKNNEHCLLMVGYDLATQTVAMADPLKGAIVNYNMGIVQARWAEQGYQAVVVPHK